MERNMAVCLHVLFSEMYNNSTKKYFLVTYYEIFYEMSLYLNADGLEQESSLNLSIVIPTGIAFVNDFEFT